MNVSPLVSICVPCYNAEKYVGEAIDSALKQTYPNIEVIVVDDGSTDRSVDVLRSFGDRIRFEACPNRGACVARNRAMELSHGPYIQFLDADDILLPPKIETLLPYLLQDKADMVWGHADLFSTGQAPWPEKRVPDPIGMDPFVYMLNNNPGTNGPLHRRSCLLKVGGFRPGLARGQEWDLHMRLGAHNVRLMQIDSVLLQIRLHDGPKISSQPRKPGSTLEFLLTLAAELKAENLLNTPQRREALAIKIAKFSMYTLRAGEKNLARQGFVCSRNLASKMVYPERKWVMAMAKVVGPYQTESILSLARRLFGRRSKS